MGKSAKKWIKTFFGKKSARSASGKEKGKAVLKLEGDKDGPDNRQTEEPLVATAPVIHQQPKVDWKDDQISKMEGGTATVDLASNIADSQRSVECDRTDILEKDKAAAKVQATFRGYLARRAFRALRGIIRLQALVRGHLVRRQAVATLRSLQGIVKLQGLIRGHIIRQSNTEQKAVTNKISVKDTKPNGLFSRNDKFPANSFTRNLLSSSPSPLPLKLQYDQSDPNSVFNWLERWTLMRSWEPAPQPKKALPGSKSRAKQDTVSLVQTVASSRSKRITKRGANVDSPGSPHASSDDGKLKRAMRKPQSSSAVDSTPEHPKTEFEKVKQNLRKISSLTPNSVPDKDKPEKEPETSKDSSRRVSISPSTPNSVTDKDKPIKELETSKDSSRRVSISPSTTNSVTDKDKSVKEPETLKDSSRRASLSPDVPDLAAGDSTEIVRNDIKLDPVNSRDVDTLVMDSPKVDQPVSLLHDNNPLNENFPSESIEKETDVCSVTTDNGTAKEIRTNHEAEKTKKRRSSFPAKADENGSPSTHTLPSYMAATESAKAKLRGQGSPRFSSENAEKNGNTRRYSLPASSNGKVSSPSLRAQRLVQASGKGSIRNDKSLLSSRDDNDKLVTEWKR